ncbi:glycosyltransferase family 2 protein [Candidatus Woesearchaeota archaeon]|nr:glycosyltransferase family 2 protein [Candidatus Woesearchaeota archaeon]
MKTLKTRVSVVIAAYNEEKYIARCLASVKNQTYNNIEAIVVSNGSTDKTAEISRVYTPYVYEIPEQSISKAKNLGISKSFGEIIAFLDADTTMENSLIEKAVACMDEGKYSGGKAKIYPDENTLTNKLYYNYVNFCSQFSRFLTLFNPALINGAGIFMFTDKAYMQRIRYRHGKAFDETKEPMEDVDFLRKLRMEKPLKFIVDSYVMTSTRRLSNEGFLKRFMADYIEYFNPKGNRTSYR